MSGRMWLGIAAFLGGALLWYFTSPVFAPGRPGFSVALLPRFALALGALGISMLASTQPGLSWTISSICFSLVSIILLAWVLVDMVRRR